MVSAPRGRPHSRTCVLPTPKRRRCLWTRERRRGTARARVDLHGATLSLAASSFNQVKQRFAQGSLSTPVAGWLCSASRCAQAGFARLRAARDSAGGAQGTPPGGVGWTRGTRLVPWLVWLSPITRPAGVAVKDKKKRTRNQHKTACASAARRAATRQRPTPLSPRTLDSGAADTRRPALAPSSRLG